MLYMLESPTAVFLLTVMEIVGPIMLLAAIAYAVMRAGRRRKSNIPAADAKTREVYRDAGSENA
jgi:hypothetical protein